MELCDYISISCYKIYIAFFNNIIKVHQLFLQYINALIITGRMHHWLQNATVAVIPYFILVWLELLLFIRCPLFIQE